MSLTLSTLPTDIIHQIQLRLFTRGDLKAFISTNKTVYSTFLQAPNSIIRTLVVRQSGLLLHGDGIGLGKTGGDGEAGLGLDGLAVGVARLVNLLDDRLSAEDGQGSVREGVIRLGGVSSSLYSEVGDEAASVGERTIGAVGVQWRLLQARDLDRLEENQRVVDCFAKRFSIRFKDSFRLYDSLTFEEARRVHTTAYTLWRLQLKHLIRKIDAQRNDTLDSNSPNSEHALLVKDLEGLSTVELLRLQTFKEFLLGEIRAFGNRGLRVDYLHHRLGLTRDQARHHLLSLGLSNMLPSSLQDLTVTVSPFSPSSESREHLWLTDALREVIEARDDEKTVREDTVSLLVLNKGTILDKCLCCNRRIEECGPPTFYNVTNLEEIEPRWSISTFPSWEFSRNPLEMDRVCRRILDRPATMSTDLLRNDSTIPLRLKALTEIFEHATVRLESRQGVSDTLSEDEGSSGSSAGSPGTESWGGYFVNRQGYSGGSGKKAYRWKPLDPLCSSCFQPVLQDCFYEWWVDERVSERVEPREFKEDCWYGKNCRTQRKLEHASRLNHCCPQTRITSPLMY